MNDLPSVYEYGGEPVTTSRAVAEQFGKQHKHVIQSVESIIAELNGGEPNFRPTSELNGGVLNFQQTSANNREFAARNFFLTEYTDTQGKKQKQYILTRDGFTLLAMGFTGAKAMQFKIAYITAFNRMEQLIRGNKAGMLESAQRAAVQLGTVESIAGAGKSTAADEVATQTIAALRAALDSGAVSIRRKYTGVAEDNCIGLYDDYRADIFSKELYKLYSSGLSHPLPYITWYYLLKQSRLIYFGNFGKSRSHHISKAIVNLSDIGFNPDKKKAK